MKIFFAILNGKPLILNFIGETLQRRAHLQLLKDVYHLPPVPIGLEWPITYPIEVKNLGITTLKYQIDTSALSELNSSNFQFRVFDIQNPETKVLPRPDDTAYIYTQFLPLEAKEYALDLPIKVQDIEGVAHSTTLKLRGVGYDPKEGGKPEEQQFYEDLPKCRAHLEDSGSQAAFSTEVVDFGDVRQKESAHHFVILYNLHPTQKLKFKFEQTGLTW